MYGEYKTPGGKLAMADLNVREGRLKDVEVSGDFFLEPPEALSGITDALEDAPAVVLGRFQSIRNEVNEEAAREHGIQVVRRMTGSGAMFVETKNVITS